MRKTKNNPEREAAQQRAKEEAARALGGLSLGNLSGNDLGTISAGNESHVQSFADKNFAAPKGQILVNDTRFIEVDKLDDNPHQPRTFMNAGELDQLVNDINAVGQLQAILVREHPTRKGRFQVAAGHRRKEAVKKGANAGKPGADRAKFVGKIRCEVRELSDFEMLIVAGQENLSRADLSLLDQAQYYRKVYEALSGPDGQINGRKAGWTEVEKMIGLSYRRMNQVMKITELPEKILGLIAEGTLNERHARALLDFQDDSSTQNALLRAITKEQLSGTQTEKRAKEIKKNVNSGSHSQAQSKTKAAPNAEESDVVSQETTSQPDGAADSEEKALQVLAEPKPHQEWPWGAQAAMSEALRHIENAIAELENKDMRTEADRLREFHSTIVHTINN